VDVVHRLGRRKLKAARIGAGRNFLLCEAFVNDWLHAAAEAKPQATPIAISERRAG
jgi:hypothetical protein